VTVKRAHPYDDALKHGFIWNQRMGMDVFKSVPTKAPLLVAVAVWQYSYHILAGLRDHRGPILTIANWAGQWPGLVGLLNLNGSLTKMGITYSTIWSEDFKDEVFLNGIHEWLQEGTITHNTHHVRDLDLTRLPKEEAELGVALAKQDTAIVGIFDEGSMGMYNTIKELFPGKALPSSTKWMKVRLHFNERTFERNDIQNCYNCGKGSI